MTVKDTTIAIKTLDGWEFVGTDRARGIYAENVSNPVADRMGALSCSFDLKRNPRSLWPDLGPYADTDIEIAGSRIFSGRIKGTPARDGADRTMNIQLEGWQAHLDDDVYVPGYLHTSLTDWKDCRSVLSESAVGRIGTAAGLVTVGDGAIVLGWPKGAQLTGGTQAFAGAYLDLGPNAKAKRVTFHYEKLTGAAGTGNFIFLVRGSDVPNTISTGGAGTYEDVWTDDLGTMFTSPGTINAGTFTAAHRYIAVILYWASASSFTLGEDDTMRIDAFATYSDPAYESGGASNLKADDVIRDALNRATILLSNDRSQIDPDPANPVTFDMPSFFSLDNKTPREVIQSANAYHNYETRIDNDRRMIFKALSTAPLIEVGDWSAIEFEDSSQGSGEDIYNQAIVEAQTASGDPQRILRTAGQQSGVVATPISTPSLSNPTFTVLPFSGWSGTGGWGIGRTTVAGEFDSSPAAGKISGGLTGGQVTASFTGTFKKGQVYQLTFVAKTTNLYDTTHVTLGSAGTPSDSATAIVQTGTVIFGGFVDQTVTWVPQADHTDGQILLNNSTASIIFIDSFALALVEPTLVDRRGFKRTKILQVASALDDAGLAAAQLADTYLKGHKNTPFKGKLTIGGGLREILTGRTVPVEQLLNRTNELIRLNHLIDPDTGAVGRDGRIVQVTYDRAKDQAQVDLDSTSDNFEALIARLSAFSGAH